jgi:hypothetical protein
MQMRHDKNHPLSQTPKHKRTKLQERLFGKHSAHNSLSIEHSGLWNAIDHLTARQTHALRTGYTNQEETVLDVM